MYKDQLFTNWHPMRWIMLSIGLFLGYNYIMNGAVLSGILSLFILYQTVTNTGCLLGYCSPSPQKPSNSGSGFDEVNFEEIKSN